MGGRRRLKHWCNFFKKNYFTYYRPSQGFLDSLGETFICTCLSVDSTLGQESVKCVVTTVLGWTSAHIGSLYITGQLIFPSFRVR